MPFTPSELFRTALRGIEADLDSQKKGPFEALAGAQQDEYLKRLQNEKIDLEGVPSNVFFESLWAMTVEGFFGDPVYGGNVDMISWKMIGFPGAHASFYDLVDQHGLKYEREPVSIGQDARGRMHLHPNIRATVDARPSPMPPDAQGVTRHG